MQRRKVLGAFTGIGVEVKLADPSMLQIIAEGQIKMDKVDTSVLAQLLRIDFLPKVYLSVKEQR
jgi:hypothetical protein